MALVDAAELALGAWAGVRRALASTTDALAGLSRALEAAPDASARESHPATSGPAKTTVHQVLIA